MSFVFHGHEVKIRYSDGMKVDIDPHTTEKLEALAAINGIAPERLIAQIISESVNKDARYWQEYEEDKASLEAMKQGNYMSGESMQTKMLKLEEQARSMADDAE